MKAPDRSARSPVLHCAIYTRKSSEEGLDQEFNSLDAQREACEAYVRSQKHAGWNVMPEMYDDGGLSGGTMERPALLRLLADVQARKVNVVVVYKIDRLTRSLFDFARIVETLDGRGTSFVSVTQQFNTTTSMGRLTLNVLLSFAQFEREITGERIRDKIAASKRKGMWMGGNVPLGYDARDRKLVVNAAEAETVRFIYRRYSELGTVSLLQGELDRLGIVSKKTQSENGLTYGGRRFSRGALYHLLANRIYRGEIVHKGEIFAGLHEPIVDEDLWQAVQNQLAANRVDRSLGIGAQYPSLLAGLIVDSAGRRMTPTHSVKRGLRYRYYSSATEQGNEAKEQVRPLRVPAGDVEALVADRLRSLLSSPSDVGDIIASPGLDAHVQLLMLGRAKEIVAAWPQLASIDMRALVRAVVEQVIVDANGIWIRVRQSSILEILKPGTGDGASDVDPVRSAEDIIVLEIEAQLVRRGKGMRLIIGDAQVGETDPELEKLLRESFTIRDQLLSGSDDSIEAMSKRLGLPKGYLTSRVRLTWLAPDIVVDLLRGQHPVELTKLRLLSKSGDLPHDWLRQREFLGFAAS
ncbi:recombinase family protein [Aurantimonas sp. C2-6-R+9]|uniref:recombinase family protein n=1 Tax=unclassified Aurantimonas TaxID=2638230 RepID=UPI002E175CEA|nr:MULTISPECIES: recombinase family protein [unclassified Aurantimonas]MEC5292302.1 recombinase family protein [Aurantimonas sp. C2-3-R2]MEC5382593.1 recombinase family protein [Aurantimonas sp. C2-6-R+9]MEC5413387.1 recombinase family protein [Aurantimonas sp. C2-4-R8]